VLFIHGYCTKSFRRCLFGPCSVIDLSMPHLECGNSMETISFPVKILWIFFFLSKMPICHAITLANNFLVSCMTFFWKVLPGLRLPFSTMQGGCYDLYSGYYPLLKQFHVYLPSKCLTLTILIVITRAYCQETCKTHTTLFI